MTVQLSIHFVSSCTIFTVYNIEDIQVFGMNMPFISSSEAKNAYFMSGEATNEIRRMKYTFSRFMRWNKWHIHSKHLNFLLIIYNFKRDRYFALNDVIHVRTLRHINDDIASTCNVGQNWNHMSRSRESKNFSKSSHSNYQNFLAI